MATTPTRLYDLAAIDRMTRWEIFRHVTLPPLRFTLFVFTCITTVLSLKPFDYIFAMGRGGPGDASAVLTYQLYKISFKDLNLGYGAAMSFFLLALILGSTFLLYLLWGRREERMSVKLAPWIVLALLVALLWTLLPIYWFAQVAFETPGEIAHFPPLLCAARAAPGAFFNIFGFDYRPPRNRPAAPRARRRRSSSASGTA